MANDLVAKQPERLRELVPTAEVIGYLIAQSMRTGRSLGVEPLVPSLVGSWTLSDDGLTYQFVLRKGTRFDNGEAITAEAVQFSFERYRGAAHEVLKERVATVGTPNPQQMGCPRAERWFHARP